ncbi:DUF2484 family protein [Marimonas arenosa]|uniref:DUF2484 family protein n=1 Tax=Marimonas arenosa TaxID=1795305 RepID=A0AAE3WFA8_9RHOB|nr:DUF2484 family protein [Marimonas arenosa]MDQ2091574.1 DUF2484 family protein [Marimonas arenosa]
MSISLLLGFFWVLAATVVAMLPMRRQMVPGLVLLIAAPVLIGFIGYQHGAIFAVLGLFAFVSMFRNPLRYLWKRARGERPELPPELRR